MAGARANPASQTIPATMHALVMDAFGGPEVLEDRVVPTPVPEAGEVLIRVATVGVNRQDLYTLSGRANIASMTLPHIPGNDPAGVVAALGDDVTTGGDGVATLGVGDRVVVKASIACRGCEACLAGDESACLRLQSIGLHRKGGFAEYVVAPASNVFTMPAGLGFAEATAFSQSGPVALHMLRDRAAVGPKDVVLVTSAAGAIGSAAVQISKLAGATVIAAAGGGERVDYARTLGADHVIDYAANPEFAPLVKALAPAGVTLYVESAGAPGIWAEALKTVARRGRVAVCGSHAGPVVDLDLNWLFRNRVTILGSSGSTRTTFADALALAGDGRLRPNIDSVHPFADAVTAFGRLLGRKNRGKVVLRVADDAVATARDATHDAAAAPVPTDAQPA